MTEQQTKIQVEEKKEVKEVVLVEGKLRKIIHQEGEGECPQKGQEVDALYRGTLETGEEFDSNQNRQSPFTFSVGTGQVIKGWDEGFISMKRGEKATLICSPQYAYGARGSPPRIPANATLHFDVELLDFRDKKKQKWELSIEEKIAESTKLKAEGNQFLKQGKYRQAINQYKEGIEYVDSQTDQGAKDILKVLRMNISQAYINNKQYSKAIQNCTKVLEDDEKNIKSLYRRGVAFAREQEFQNAKGDFKTILSIDANHAQAKNELIRIANQQKAIKAKQKKVFGGMFAKSGLYEDKKPEQSKEPKKIESDEENDDQQMPQLQKDEPKEQKAESTEKPSQ